MTNKLADIAQRMVAAGKGILAADESTGSIAKRLESINTPSTPDSRRDYREMLFGATEAMKANISGVILFDETLRQKARSGTPLVDVIKATGAVPGIKLDTGAKPLALSPGETVTEGLDGLAARVEEYAKLGARVRQVARRDRCGQAHSNPQCHSRQRPCAGPLCRHLPGRRHRSHG